MTTAAIGRSQIRHRPIHEGPSNANVAIPRASRPSQVLAQQRRRETRTADKQLIDTLSQTTYITEDADDTEPITRNRYQQRTRRITATFSWLTLTLGMFLMLVIWSIFVHVGAWYSNTLHDPSYYTQTAHRDMVMIDKSQVRALIDAQNHLDLIVIPDDASKSRIIVGSSLTGIDPHTATLTVTANGTTVTVLAQGPIIADWFSAYRPSAQWSTDISQKQQAQGG